LILSLKNELKLFVVKDVADILGYLNTRDDLLNHVDNEGVTIRDGNKGVISTKLVGMKMYNVQSTSMLMILKPITQKRVIVRGM